MALAAYLTDAGLVVLNKVLASTGKLEFVKAELGSGVVTGEAACRARTSLMNKIADASLVSAAYQGGEARISIQYINTGLVTGFFVNEVGLYVKDPETSANVLYCYATFGDSPDWIAPASSAQYVRTYDLITIVSNVSSVTVETSPSTLVTRDEFAELSDRVDAIARGAKIYGMRWDKTNAKGTRLFDAANITTDVSAFCYRGSVAIISNPFDSLYPFSEFKQCNVNLTTYGSLVAGQDIRDAIVAWYGDPDFKDDGTNGFVGAYRPEYWYTAYEDDGCYIFAVSTTELPGWTHSPAYIRGYGHCVDAGSSKVTCYNANPLTNTAIGTIHTYAGNSGFTIDDIYTYSAELTALVVEYCTLNTQSAIGQGCDSLYRESESDIPLIAETGATRVILPAAAAAYCVEGATLDFGATKGAIVMANRRICTGYTVYSGDSDYIDVSFKGGTLDVTTSMFVSFHGCANGAALGNVSGYVGTAGKVNSFYRGVALFGNKWRYVLGAYRQKDTGAIWICPPDDDPDDYDALDTSKHVNTGLVLPLTAGYIKSLGIVPGLGAVPFCVEVGGSAGSSNPVGDYCYVPSIDTANTILIVGGGAYEGALGGSFFGGWDSSSSYSSWGAAASPVLK